VAITPLINRIVLIQSLFWNKTLYGNPYRSHLKEPSSLSTNLLPKRPKLMCRGWRCNLWSNKRLWNRKLCLIWHLRIEIKCLKRRWSRQLQWNQGCIKLRWLRSLRRHHKLLLLRWSSRRMRIQNKEVWYYHKRLKIV